MEISAIILASGKGKRMGIAKKKQFMELGGQPVLLYSVNKFLKIPEIEEVILVISREDESIVKKILPKSNKLKIVFGGKRRQDSSTNGVKRAKYDYVAIHDAVRPNFKILTLKKMINELENYDCVVPFVKARDTIRYGAAGIETLERNNVKLIQTPQLFRKEKILKALEMSDNIDITDDMDAYLRYFDDYKLIEGDNDNIKITTVEDYKILSSIIKDVSLRVGFGYDSHRLKDGNGLILGGVEIPYNYSVVAHSDGDVIIHSLIDALLGATGMGDIGDMFPDTEDWTLNISGKDMIELVLKKIGTIEINNIDIVIILDEPKLGKIKEMIKEHLAEYLKIDAERISVKAKTTEGRHNEKKIEVFSQILINYFN